MLYTYLINVFAKQCWIKKKEKKRKKRKKKGPPFPYTHTHTHTHTHSSRSRSLALPSSHPSPALQAGPKKPPWWCDLSEACKIGWRVSALFIYLYMGIDHIYIYTWIRTYLCVITKACAHRASAAAQSVDGLHFGPKGWISRAGNSARAEKEMRGEVYHKRKETPPPLAPDSWVLSMSLVLYSFNYPVILIISLLRFIISTHQLDNAEESH